MATIHLSAMQNCNGPEIPGPLSASLAEREWPGGGKVPVLRLTVGQDTLEIWPADPARIRELSEELRKVAALIEARVKYREIKPGKV